MKNTKLMKSNLFVQKILSLDIQDSCMIILESFGMIWYQIAWKRLKK